MLRKQAARRQPSGPRRRYSQPYWTTIWRARTQPVAERCRGKSDSEIDDEARQRHQRLVEQREVEEAHRRGDDEQ